MNQPLVSIITPTYNRADLIGEAIESVLAQTYPHWELLIVDDGSTDNTREVIEPYLKDERIQYIYQENQRQAAARNNALSHANGELISFLDSDNRLLPQKLEWAVDALASHPEVDIVYGDIITIDETGREVTRENMKRYSGMIARHLLVDNCVSMNTAVVRRRCFDEMGGFNTERKVGDDYDLWLRFSARYRYLYIPRFMAEYRVMDDQISSDKTRRFASNLESIKEFLDRFPDAVSPRDARKSLARFHARKGRYHTTQGEWSEAAACVLKALMYAPLSPLAWRVMARIITQRRSS